MRRAPRRAGRLVIAVLLSAPPAAAADLVAERITERNVAERQIGGPDAIGGVGDWYLANDRVEIVVDDPSRRHGKFNTGGTIVDAGVRGRDGDDQFARLYPLVNLDLRVKPGYDQMRAEVDPEGRFARLVVTGSDGFSSLPRGGFLRRRFDPLVPEPDEIARVVPETSFEVRPGEPFVRIRTTLRNEGAGAAPIFSYGEIWMRGGRSMRSFVGNVRVPERAPGFHHRGFDRNAILAASDAMAASSFVAMAGLPHWPPIAYALVAPERAAEGRMTFGVTNEHVTFVNAFVADPGWGALSLWRILAATRGELAPGASWSFERRLLITPGRDVAASTDLLFPLLGVADGASGLCGRVEPEGLRASVQVARADGTPVTQIAARTAGPEAGSFRAVLPPGDYALVVRAEHRTPRRVEVRVEPGRFAEVAPVRFGPVGGLRFATPAFADGGPGRVVVAGLGDTPDPVFRSELLDFRLDGVRPPSGTATRALLFTGGEDDPQRVSLPAGRYQIVATRGPEYDVVERRVEVDAGAEIRLAAFAPVRVVELPGYTSADFHVHAEASDDSGMDNETRLRSYVAEAIDVMVGTDHGNVGDFRPALAALGLDGRIRVVHGVEVTSSTPSRAAPYTIGHHNAWPVPFDPTAHRHGAPPSQERSLADLYGELRHHYGARVVQLNHPLRAGGRSDDGAYWSHLGSAGEPYDPSLPIDAEPNRGLLAPGSDGRTRGLDFDAVEVMNGDDFGAYRAVREAWYSLLRQGFRRTATGNSDSHGPDSVAGYPRNYVAVSRDADPADFDRAVREGRLFATTGPLVTRFRAGGAGIGQQLRAPGGAVRVEIGVAAAPWVPVDEVRLLVNGALARRFPLRAAPDGIQRLATEVDLALRRDAFLTLEAGAPLDADPPRWIAERGGVYASLVAPGHVSQAITNPIWVDVDGDGEIAAPGIESNAGTRRLFGTLLAIGLLALVWWRLRVRAQAV